MKTDPLVKERIHSVSQKIIRWPLTTKHIQLIRMIISNVVPGLDGDSRWMSVMCFPDDTHCKKNCAQGDHIWETVGSNIKEILLTRESSKIDLAGNLICMSKEQGKGSTEIPHAIFKAL